MCRHTGAYFSLKTDDWYDSRWTRSQSWKHSSRPIHWEIKPTSSRQQRKFSCQAQKQSACLMRSGSLIPTPTQQEMSGWTDRWTDSQTHEWPGLARRRAWLLGSPDSLIVMRASPSPLPTSCVLSCQVRSRSRKLYHPVGISGRHRLVWNTS